MRGVLDRLGGKTGLAVCVAGFIAVFLGWNGAATYDRVPAQFPYLISGGVVGLGLIVLGAALVIVENQRADRARLEAELEALRDAVDRLAAAAGGARASGGTGQPQELVLAASSTYHRPGCHLVEGREDDLPVIVRADALERGLRACRVCKPDGAGAPTRAPAGAGRRS